MDKITDQLTLTPKLLGLSNIIINEEREARDGSIVVTVKSNKSETLCRHCQQPTELYGHRRTLTLRHLPILGREVYINITPPRGICKRCDNHPTTALTLSWFEHNRHHIKPYDDYSMLQLIESTQSDVDKKENLTEEILQGVMDRYTIDEVDWKSIKRIGLLGIDEIAKKKGHKDYITLITSRYQGSNKILAVIKGKETATIKAFLSSLPKKKKKTITAVCVDMCDTYISAAQSVFSDEIPIIVDRSHVAKLYRQAIIQLRSHELNRLKKELTQADYQSLCPAIRILMSKQECYSKQDKKVLAPLFILSPAIKAAYRLTRELTIIYNKHHKKRTAQRKITGWVNKVKASSVNCLTTFIKTLSRYEDYITNYFLRRETSGFVEGINNKVKVIKRRCYGILNIKHFSKFQSKVSLIHIVESKRLKSVAFHLVL